MEPQKDKQAELEALQRQLEEQQNQLEKSREELRRDREAIIQEIEWQEDFETIFGPMARQFLDLSTNEAERTVRKAVSGMLSDPQLKKLTGRAKADEVARGITGSTRQAYASINPERPATLPQAKLTFYALDDMCRRKPELKADVRALVQKYLPTVDPYQVLACSSLVELLGEGLGAVPLPAEIDLNQWANRKPLYHIYAEPELLAAHYDELQPLTYAMLQWNVQSFRDLGPGSPLTRRQYHVLRAELDPMMQQPDGKEKSEPLQRLARMDLLHVLESPDLKPEQTLEQELIRWAPYVPLAVFTNDPARAEDLLELAREAEFTWKLRIVRCTPERGFEDWDLIRKQQIRTENEGDAYEK